MSDTPERPDPERLPAIVGAAIFAADGPVRPEELADALGLEPAAVRQAIEALRADLERSDLGLCLEWIAGGVRMATGRAVAPWLRRFFRERNRTRLSTAALETLAIIAYRQPVTVAEIQAIRGKDPTAALRGLVERKLVRCLGRKKVVGHPMLYGTSREFLVHFGLNDLEDLPSIDEFEKLLYGTGLGESLGGAAEGPAETEDGDEPLAAAAAADPGDLDDGP